MRNASVNNISYLTEAEARNLLDKMWPGRDVFDTFHRDGTINLPMFQWLWEKGSNGELAIGNLMLESSTCTFTMSARFIKMHVAGFVECTSLSLSKSSGKTSSIT